MAPEQFPTDGSRKSHRLSPKCTYAGSPPEAVEREFSLPIYNVEAWLGAPSIDTFTFTAESPLENLVDANGRIAGVIVRATKSDLGIRKLLMTVPN